MTDIEKLKHLLKHWIEHNDAHVKTYSEWASKTESMGEKDLSNLLNQVVDESRKLDDLLKKAMEII
jgi:hypothetical protein